MDAPPLELFSIFVVMAVLGTLTMYACAICLAHLLLGVVFVAKNVAGLFLSHVARDRAVNGLLMGLVLGLGLGLAALVDGTANKAFNTLILCFNIASQMVYALILCFNIASQMVYALLRTEFG